MNEWCTVLAQDYPLNDWWILSVQDRTLLDGEQQFEWTVELAAAIVNGPGLSALFEPRAIKAELFWLAGQTEFGCELEQLTKNFE